MPRGAGASASKSHLGAKRVEWGRGKSFFKRVIIIFSFCIFNRGVFIKSWRGKCEQIALGG